MLARANMLFPTGCVRPRRWLHAVWFMGGALTLASATVIVYVTRLWSDPFGSSAQAEPPALVAAFSLALAALAVSVAAVVVRFARSVGEERLQLKWFAAAAVLVLVVLIATFPITSGAVHVLGDL